ncbi:hypothetical protein ACQP2F_25090 [Actinoplanes sp. CA-030573]|uniref:hypothetical protein n=1 Tax=Actinoplanes sp. CA-030573 TaxID=3239898 RepID=UPI003D8AC0F3
MLVAAVCGFLAFPCTAISTHADAIAAHTAASAGHTAHSAGHTAAGTAHTATDTAHTAAGASHTAAGTAHTATGASHTAAGTAHSATDTAQAAHPQTGSGQAASGATRAAAIPVRGREEDGAAHAAAAQARGLAAIPGTAGLARSNPAQGRAAQEEVAPGQAAPGRVAQGEVAPGRAGRGQVAPRRVAQGEVTPGRAGRGQTARAAGRVDVSPSGAGGRALAGCIAEARSRQARRWVCAPDGLTTVDIKGRTSGETIAAPGGTGLSDRCDDGVCHRRMSSYVDVTWGGVAFGHGREVIGRFDVVLRTNLGGLGSQWRTTVVPRSGPPVALDDAAIVCRHGNGYRTDEEPAEGAANGAAETGANGTAERAANGAAAGCESGAPTVPRLSTPGWRWENESIGGRYYNAVSGTFTADGYGRFPMGTIASSYFFCAGPGNCRFAAS